MITHRIGKERSGESKEVSSKDIKQDVAFEKRAEKKVIKALNESAQIPPSDNGIVLGADSRNPYNDPTLPGYNPNLSQKKNQSSRYAQRPVQDVRSFRLSRFGRFGLSPRFKSTSSHPFDADAWYTEGLNLDYERKYEKAIEKYDKALEIKPNYAEALHKKGRALVMIGKYKEAIECYDKALEIEPNDTNAWKDKGLALEKIGKKKEAKEYFKKARELGSWQCESFAYGHF